MKPLEKDEEKVELLQDRSKNNESVTFIEIEKCVNNEEEPSIQLRIFAALFYSATSLGITMVNKTVLTTYGFPSYQGLAFSQLIATVIILQSFKTLGIIHFPDLTSKTVKEIFPLPLIYFGNMVFGLGGTKEISLPMFTMLRRFSILMTMIAEYYILGVIPTIWVNISVFLMIGGAVVAAVTDLAFNLEGYSLVTLSNVLTAVYGVYTKKMLALNMGAYGLIFYSALFVLPLSAIILVATGDLWTALDYPSWSDLAFCFQFFLSSVMGFLLIYSTVLCTKYNSALTTSIVGCLKNIAVTYVGMFVGGDYLFSIENFMGINMSVVGSVIYTYVTFKPSRTKKPVEENKESKQTATES